MSLSKNKVNQALQSRGGFSIVPNELWRLDIPYPAKTIWAYLVSQHPNWVCSRNNIARNLKLGRKSVTDMLKLLSDHKMIEVKVGKKGTWHIDMSPPDLWVVPEITQEADPLEDIGLSEKDETETEDSVGEVSKTGSNRDRFYLEPVSVDPTSNTRREEKEKAPREVKELPSVEDIYRKWLSEVPERPDFKACYEELLVLFDSLKTSGYTSDQVSPSFKKKILKRWERSKYPDKHIAWLDKALGATFFNEIKLSVPELKTSSGVKIKRIDGQITLDTALAMATDDDVIQRMMREYEEIRSRPSTGGDFDDE